VDTSFISHNMFWKIWLLEQKGILVAIYFDESRR